MFQEPRILTSRFGSPFHVSIPPTWTRPRHAFKPKFYSGKVHNSDGTPEDVQAIHDDAGTGTDDIITLPEGSFPWASGVTLSKGVHVQGAGSGRVVAWSASSVSIGTGAKVFTVQAGLSIADGTTLRIWQTATDKSEFMLGTVTSLVGTTLTMNITSSNGSGSHTLWLIATEPKTVITHNASTTDLFSMEENAERSVELSGIYFTNGTGTGAFIRYVGVPGGEICQAHDIWFHRTAPGDCFRTLLNRGLLYEISATASEWALSNFLVVHNPYGGLGDDTTAWERPMTWGADDDGTGHLYVEDCDFHGWLGLADAGENAIATYRHCKFNHAGINSHGRDNGEVGMRAYEYYDNTCYFANLGASTLPLLYWISFRGGTGVICDNVMPNITSSEWGNQPEVFLQVLALSNTPPFIGWSYNDGGVPEYPAPRQVGLGYVTGLAGTENGHYFGDSEPIYIYNNVDENGDPITPGVGLNGAGGDPLADDVNDYVQAGRDYIIDGTAKPGFVKFEYPHPAREGGVAPSPNMQPQFTVDPVVTGTPTVGETLTTDDGTVTGNPVPTITYQWYRCTTP